MLAKEFYRTVISNEECAYAFLKEYNLLNTSQETELCHKCSSVMQEKRKRNRKGEFRPVFRCPRKGCQTSRSIRTGNPFFHYTDMNGKVNCKLKLCEILELMFFFVMDIPLSTTMTLTGKTTHTVTYWFNMCREVCGVIVSHHIRSQMVGTEEAPIQVDDERFEETLVQTEKQRKRKKNRGRILTNDHTPLSEDTHLDYFYWKMLRKNEPDLFIAFLQDVQAVYKP